MSKAREKKRDEFVFPEDYFRIYSPAQIKNKRRSSR